MKLMIMMLLMSQLRNSGSFLQSISGGLQKQNSDSTSLLCREPKEPVQKWKLTFLFISLYSWLFLRFLGIYVFFKLCLKSLKELFLRLITWKNISFSVVWVFNSSIYCTSRCCDVTWYWWVPEEPPLFQYTVHFSTLSTNTHLFTTLMQPKCNPE